MMMSYAEAVEFINPAYNPNVASFFPQPVLNSPAPIAADSSQVASSNEESMTVAAGAGSFNGSNATNQQIKPHGVELQKKKPAEVLRCEICNVSCNSKLMLEKHIMGKKHKKKTAESNPEALMLDSVKSDECMEGVEIKNIPGAGLEEMSKTTLVSCGTHTMPKPLGKCSDVVSEIHIPKHQGFSSSVEENTCNEKDVDVDGIMSYKKQSSQPNDDNSADSSHLNSASRTFVQICTVCNVFSHSQADLEKHLAGKTHARKVKYLNTLMSSSVSVYPHNESHTLKLASDAISQPKADPSSVIPFGCPKIQEPIHSESGNVISSENGTPISSSKMCTICNIKCNSQEIFQGHLSGKKHASKVRMLGSTVHKPSTIDQGATERASKRGKVVQFAYCDVCKIHCNSSEILDAHMMGKKHMKQLEKLGK